MKIKSGILKAMLTGFLAIVLVCISVFTIAGFVPLKDNIPGKRHSVYVTMKDGTKIAVRYILPNKMESDEKIPAVIEGTRYGTQYKESFLLCALENLKVAREIPPAMIVKLLEAKYAYVAVDSRGSGASFGSRDMEWSREEMQDLGQVMDWIVKQPWSNGKVGTYGISYSGNTAELAMALNNPALKAAAPLYDDFEPVSEGIFPGGIFNEFLVKNWCEANIANDENKKTLYTAGTAPVEGDRWGRLLRQAVKGHKTIDLYAAFNKATYFDDVLSGDYKVRSLGPCNFKSDIEKSGVPLYVRVGWQDAGTVNGAIERFLTYNNKQTLVIGPWSHAGWHLCDPLLKKPYSRKELEEAQADEVIAFFDCYLKKDNKTDTPGKQIKYYTLGEGKWKTTDTWPVKGFENKVLYFGANGSLNEVNPGDKDGKDEYKVDFTATTGETTRWRTNLGGGAVIYPDRAQEDKKLLTYTSQAVQEDTEITGVPVVNLNLSSTSRDGAFYVYLEDVSPDGKVTYITEGELRALHRKVTTDDLGYTVLGPKHSYMRKDGEQLKPSENAELKIGMYATSVLIKKGHRIRIAVAGHDASNFRRILENTEPTIELQRNSILSSYVELPMKTRN